MATKRRYGGRSPAGITIDIDELGPGSKLSELTVEQFVQLLAQSYEQLGSRRATRQGPRTDFVRRLLDTLNSESEAVRTLKNGLRDIAKALPQVLLAVARQLKEEANQKQAERQEKPDHE